MYWTSDYSWRLVGTPSVRQQRVYDVPCNSFVPPVNRCIPHWSSLSEDKDPYNMGWSVYSPSGTSESSMDDPWVYHPPTANWLETFYRLQGQSDIVYNNGGYKARIGSSIKETVKTTTQLVVNHWIDQMTKSVFIELTLYNVDLRSLSQITLIIEFLTADVSLRAARVTSVIIDCDDL
ncbi:polycystic kidney disease protein 1-like 3 [Macrosteles quadrilineatus]|uniref:polycystic kidney disease protein 1-like 3 n=1 Tax=Macrosteles quadrilineatus TaxID=74068 RepID=UPI0023E1C7D5|nr:polycystic kidney disease protein 1-like 3 [Macrosteles quadrilineatus]